MIPLNFLTFSALAAIIALTFAILWTQLPNAARQPVAVYVGSYLVTYCVGGVWIGLSNGEALTDYFRDRIYIPSVETLGAAYWYVLLAPVIIPVCVTAVLAQQRRARSPVTTSTALNPS